jgi:hypothetical protein
MTDLSTPLAYVPLFLPSKGVLYDGRIPEGKVEARKMTVAEISAFESSGTSAADKIERLLKSCVRLPNGFEHRELLMADRMAALFGLRTITLGADYRFDFKCKYCGHVNHANCNLTTDLEQRTPVEGLAEPITVTLPDTGKVLKLRFLRGKDEEAVAKYAKRIKMSSVDNDDPSLPYRIATQIVKIDDEEHGIMDRERFVKGLPLGDLMAIADTIEELEPGISLDLMPDCVKCQSGNEVSLDMSVEFFRPHRRKS